MATVPMDLIVPVDGSDHADAAARYAARMALALDAEVHLVHAFPGTVQQVMQYLGRTPRNVSTEKMSAEAFETLRNGSARRAFQHAREHMREGLTVTEHVLDGEPADAITAFVKDGHDVQVIMGRRGIGRIQELLLGSVSERVIQRVPGPVTVVTAGREAVETPDGEPVPLVVPVDGSHTACAAARHAAARAAQTGATVHLLHAFPGLTSIDPAFNSSISTSGMDPVSRDQLSTIAKLSADEAFASAHQAIGTLEHDAPRLLEIRRMESPARAINGYLRELGTAEVVMGRRGLGRVESLLLGSVSQRVLHGAGCPVTVIG